MQKKGKGIGINWLPFLNTYRTMCLAPEPPFRRVLEEITAWTQARERSLMPIG
jgi:hypothetical protein